MPTSNNTTAFSNETSRGLSPSTPISAEELKVIATSFFSIISILGVFGNLMVIITVIRWRDMRTPCNYLIANISVADMVVTLFMAPMRVIEQYTNGSWIFGKVVCYVFAPLQDALVCVSVYTFTAIAMERYRAIINPFKPRLNKTQVKVLILLVWIGCYSGTGLPLAFFVSHKKVPFGYICFAAIPPQDFHIFALYLVIVFIALPLVLQMFCYVRVIVALRKKDAIDQSSDSNATKVQRQGSRQRVAKKRRLMKMLIVLMVIFHVCYVPRGIIMLIYEFAPFVTRSVVFAYVNIITMLLYYVKHIMNPIILCGMSTDFRAAFAGLFRCSSMEQVQFGSSSAPHSDTGPSPLQRTKHALSSASIGSIGNPPPGTSGCQLLSCTV